MKLYMILFAVILFIPNMMFLHAMRFMTCDMHAVYLFFNIIFFIKSTQYNITNMRSYFISVGQRHANMESLYDYGSRAGFWRLHDLLLRKNVPCTVFAVGMALERNPTAANAMVKAGWEVASHGYRWWDYQNVEMNVEREHIRRTVQIHKDMLGVRPVGMYQGKPNINTRRLVVEEGGFLYDSDAYSDDLPYWTNEYDNKPHLIIPYTLSENDMRFASVSRGRSLLFIVTYLCIRCKQLTNLLFLSQPNGFSNANQFSSYLIDNLNYLIEEGRRGSPKMMSVGLHCRLVGRPGRAKGLEDFLDYVKSLGDDVWVCRRDEIATHWYKNHYPEDLKSSL